MPTAVAGSVGGVKPTSGPDVTSPAVVGAHSSSVDVPSSLRHDPTPTPQTVTPASPDPKVDTAPKPDLSTSSDTGSKVEANTNTDTKVDTKAEVAPLVSPKPTISTTSHDPSPAPNSDSHVKPEPHQDNGGRTDHGPNTTMHPDAKSSPNPSSDLKMSPAQNPAVKTEPKVDGKPDTRPEAKGDTSSGPKGDSKPGTKTSPVADPKVSPNPATKNSRNTGNDRKIGIKTATDAPVAKNLHTPASAPRPRGANPAPNPHTEPAVRPSTSPNTGSNTATGTSPNNSAKPSTEPGKNPNPEPSQDQNQNPTHNHEQRTTAQRIESYGQLDPANRKEMQDYSRFKSYWDTSGPQSDAAPPRRDYAPSERAFLRRDDGSTVGLTPLIAAKWQVDHGQSDALKPFRTENVHDFIYPKRDGAPVRVYDVNDIGSFLKDVATDAGAREIEHHQAWTGAVHDFADWVTGKYPPERFSYVGLGRSPAPVLAALQSNGHDAVSVPLSKFRPGPSTDDSVLNTAFEGDPGLTKDQQDMLGEHFAEFLNGLPRTKNIVVIDYTESAKSLLAAQHYLQQRLDRLPGPKLEVHALAMHQQLETDRLNRTIASITGDAQSTLGWAYERMLHPDRAAQRDQFRDRFHMVSLDADGPLGPNGKAFSDLVKGQRFDDLAEYGSYNFQGKTDSRADFDNGRPHRRHEPNPDGSAYDALKESIGTRNPANPEPANTNAPPKPPPSTNPSAEKNPGTSTKDLPPAKDWSNQRDSAPATRFSSERFDPAKSISQQFTGNREGLRGGQLGGAITQMRYDVRRFEESPGNWVREFTVPLDLTSQSGSVSIDARNQLAADLQSHLDATVNQHYRLPGGDQLHVRVDANATNDIHPNDDSWESDSSRGVPVNIHDSTVDENTPATNQLNWDVHDASTGLTHEVMHFLGLGEGYRDSRLLFNRQDTPGVMGPDAWTDSSLTPQNLSQLENVSNTANIRDHHLGDPAATTPSAPHHTPAPDHHAEPKPTLHYPTEAPSSAHVTVNGSRTVDATPGTVVRRDAFDPDQHTMLGVHGLDAVIVGGDTTHENFRQAIAHSLPDNTPRETARITSQLEGSHHTDLGQIAHDAGVRVHVLDPGGGWTSHGPETGRPVHIVKSTVDGKDTYLGTKENVHIGRPGVSYPGPTVLDGDRKVVHRGEFEVETVRGEHYVRMYTAVLDPAARDSDFKDVHQNADGTVDVFAGGTAQTFWVGGGRPMRAVQWAAKYEHDANRGSDMQPVLRSFLVPLKTFNQVSREATVEALSKDNSLAMNVDQAGDTNQFGLRGEHFEQMRDNALKGSLVTYAPGGKDIKLPDLAGRREDISDLYVRLGLSPDFDSAGLGRENDPWFDWSKESGQDRKYFSNDPGKLSALAKTLSGHYHTWKGSPEAFFTPPGDSTPGVNSGQARDSQEQRQQDLNVFLNTHGPSGQVVGQLTDGIGDALTSAVDAGPHTVPLDGPAVRDQVLIEAKNLNNALTTAVTNLVRERAKGPDGFVPPTARIDTIEGLRDVMSDPSFVDEVAKRAAEQMVDNAVNTIGATHGTQDFRAGLNTIVQDAVKSQFALKDGKFSPEVEKGFQKTTGSKRGYFTGPRVDVIGGAVSKHLKADGNIETLVHDTGLGLDRETVKQRLSEHVVPEAVSDVAKQNLVDASPDQLKDTFRNALQGGADRLRKNLNEDPVLKFAVANERTRLGDAAAQVINDPHTVDGITFTPVTREQADAFMDKVPDYATQAEIGAAIATDERRVKVDFNTRENQLDPSRTKVESKTFENEYGHWGAGAVPGHTRQHPAGVFERHQQIGRSLGTTIGDQLARPDERSAKAVLDHLVREADRDNPDRHDSLRRKFDEVVKADPKNPRYRTGDTANPNTFGEHAQMVLNQYLRLTQGQNDNGRFVSRDALAKAILFHDMEKVNSKNQFGDGQGRHDREPEHRGAVDQMNRHEGLWGNSRDFRIARAMVDADPFGFYFRPGKGLDVDGVHSFIKGLAHQVGSPRGGAPTAVDVRNLFNEFHEYYQAGFSSYFSDSHFAHEQHGDVRSFGKPALSGLKTDPDGKLVTTDGGHRFAYLDDKGKGAKQSYEQKYRDLRDRFDKDVAKEEQERVVYVNDDNPATGVTHDSDRGVQAVKESNPNGKPSALARVRMRDFTNEEKGAIDDALGHYSPIIGDQRANSSRAGVEQEVRHIGAVNFGLERGEIAYGMGGEYIGSHQTVNLYAPAMLSREFGGGQRGLEGTVTHELSHGLLKYALDDYGKHVGSWNEDGSPNRGPDAEPPSDAKARSDQADFKAAVKSHLLGRAGLEQKAPRRAEFVAQLEQQHPDVFARQGTELSGPRAERVYQALKDRQADFNEHTGYWDRDGFPSFTGERPITKYGATNVNEDMAETAKYYFLDPDKLRAEAPRRAAFFDQLVSDWKKPSDDTVLVADNETDTPPDDRALRDRLPEYARDGQALGALVPVDVQGAKDVGTTIERLIRNLDPGRTNPPKPVGIDAITGTLDGPGFESFLGPGRKSMVRVGEKWYEVHVKAEPDLAAVGADQVTKQPNPTIADVNDQNQTTHAQPQTDSTTGTVGSSYFGLFPAGPYASVGATAQLASPSAEHTSTVTGTEQRVIRSAGEVDRADVPVKYTITVSDQNGGPTGSTVDGRVSLLLPQDLANLKPHTIQGTPTPPKPDWHEQIEFLTPEAVLLDEQSLFNQVSALLHPSVTKFGAPGRSALQDFVSGGGIRGVLGTAMQGSPVVSNDLLSPHGSHRDAVQLQARPKGVELVGVVPGDSELRFNDSSVNGGSTAATSKSGLDVNAIFGGGAYIPGAVGGVGGVSGSASAKVSQTSTSGTNVTTKSTVNAKGDVGLYKVKVDVEVTTASGDKATVEATAYVRMGLPEAKAQGLPVPEGTRDKLTDVGKRHEPPYLASAVAAGQARAGSFTPAAKVQPQIENALRDRPGFGKFLPRWDKFQSDSKGSTRDVAERLANLRKLTSAFSPAALKSKMDSLLGPGVSVQLKRRGLFTDEYLSVTVKAKVGPGEHLGQATGRSVKGSVASSPSLNTSTTTEKGWSAGLEGRMIIPGATAITSLGISPTVTPVQYSDSRTWKNTGGPTVTTTLSAGGSPDSQVFSHDVEFEVEITSYTRNRPWVKRLTPGSPFRVTPTVSTVAKTGDGGGVALPKISGKVDLWVNDGSALKKDPAEFTPGKSGTVALTPSETPRIDDLARQPNPPKFLHVEAFANTEVLRDEALRQLQRAAGGDAVLGLPGGEARNRVDRMFSPETFRNGLPRFLSQGAQSGGFRYERRVADRVGGLGMGMSLSNPKLVVTSDAGGSDTTYAGGGKAGYENSRKQAVEANAQLGLTIRPDGSDTHGQGQIYGSLKWSPWVRTSGSSKELSASVDHVNRAPSKSRTVLVQYDADVRLVAESRQESLVNGSTARSGADVKLPGAVFVRMTEDQAREQGLLPALEPRTAPPGELTSPALVGAQSSSLGAAVVENAPDLSQLVRDARTQLGRTGDKLLPKSVLDDSMNNLQRMLDLASPESVTSLVDSSLDGGVPLVLHDAGILSTDSYQVLLKGTVTSGEFLDVVHDGGEVDHVVNSGCTAKANSGHGSSYGGQFRGAGRGLFQSTPSKTSGYDGAYAGISGTKSKSDQTVSTDTTTSAHTASAGGPAVRHRHQVRFELVVQRGGRTYPIAHQDTRLTVRSSADDQKISAQNQPARTAYAPRTTELTPADATPERLTEWRQQGTGPLPRSALTEGLRGAGAVRAGAVRALRLAGAGDGLTGPGTGANNTLVSSVTNEMLQANLPGMVERPLEAPDLHEAAIFKNGHGSVKVYARLVSPDLAGLSDSVKLERSDQATNTFTGEAKQTVSGENQYNLGNGGLTDPSQNAHSWGGVDGRSPVGISDATATTSGGQRSVVGKPKGRTGLVGFDVEYRVVADLGDGRTGAVEVRVPASALVRMSDADLETLLGGALPDSLTKAQDAVKDAATEWRTAEEAVETAQREADDRWLEQRDSVKTLTKGAGELQVDVTADPARGVRQALADAENDARDAGRTLRDGNTEIVRQQDIAAQALSVAASTDEGSPERQALLDQVTRAEQRIQDIRDGQPALVQQRQAAQDRVARLAGVLDEYRNDHSDQTARRDSSLEDVRQAREKADAARQKWWDAKQNVDRRLDTHVWPRRGSTLDPNAARPIRRKPVPPATHRIPRKPVPQPTPHRIPRKPVPQPSTTAGPSTEPHRDGTVEARDTEPATISGWDAGSGRPYDFDVSEIELHQVTDRSGKVVAVSFLPASEQTSGVEHDWVADNSGTVSTLDEGVTPDRFDPALKDARDNGTTPDLNGRRFGEWAEQSAAPWGKGVEDNFFVFAHGRPQSVRLTLLGGRTVRVDGAAFARIVANSAPFGQSGPKSSVTLIACSTGQADGPGGVAHDFQRALSELGGPVTVHAPTRPALFGRDTATLGRAVGAIGGFTAVTDGGHFRTFGGRPGDEAIVGLVRELEQGNHAELPDGPIPLSDHDGTLALTSTVERQLADEAARTGELRLTSVQDLVARHDRPDVIWSAALTRLAGRPDIDVHTIVDTRRDPETGEWTRTPLPPMARGLLTVTGKGSWGEHELARPARLNPAWSTGPARETTPTRPDARDYAETLVEHHLDGASSPSVTVPADVADRFKADVTRLLDERPFRDFRPSLDELVHPGVVLTQDGYSANELVTDLRAAAVGRGPALAPLLGPDLFGLYRAPEPPEFLRGHDYRYLTAGQGIELLDVLDLAKGYQLASEHTDPANLADSREWTIETERDEEKLAAWAPGDVEPLTKVTATPLLMHAIWLGGPLRDAGTMHTFRQNFGGAADRLNESVVPVLWTDVPRWQTDLAFTTEPPADGPDPLADVRDFVGWAQEHGIRLANVDEVFTSENPMLLQEFYNSEALKQAGPGYAAASDILRMELLHRFGGLYTDGDNVVHNLNDVILAARSDEGYATHRVGTKIANSAFTMSKGHPFARAYLDQQRENYGKTQKNLMPANVNALGQEFFATPLGRVHRNSIMHRTGPEALSQTARRIGLASAQQLPGMSEIRMNSDASWLKPPPAGESAPPSPGRGETLELTQRVVQTLVRGLYNRDGDLHLTAVESTVNRHPEPDLVWHAALSYLAADPELAPLVRTVTDQRGYTGTVHDVQLPPAARVLLDIDPSRVHRNLGEVQRAATMREPGAVLVSDVETPLETAAGRLARALVEADDRGEPLTPIHVTGTGPHARVRAMEVAKELAGHLGREFGESRRDLLARVPVKIRAGERDTAGVTVSFRPEHGTAVEVDLGRSHVAHVFHGFSEPADAVARPWQHEGRTIGAHYTEASTEVTAFDALPRFSGEGTALVHDFTEHLRTNGFDLPLHLGTDPGFVDAVDRLPGVSYLVAGDHPLTDEDKRVLTELSRAAELDWWHRPMTPTGLVRLEDRSATLKLLSGVLGKLRHSVSFGPALDLTAAAADVARHERPDLVWSAALELATMSETVTGDTRYIIDRRLDPATGRWSPVELPEAARERFTVTGKAIWQDGAVYRPVRLHAEPGRLRDRDEQPPAPLPLTDERAVARWIAESIVERMADGLAAPRVAVSGPAEVRDRLVARIQADLAALTPAGVTPTAAAELVTVAPGNDAVATISLPLKPSPATLSPAETAVAVGLEEEFTLLQLHGVTDTLLGKQNPAAVGVLLDLATEVAGGADVGETADAVEILDRHGALDAALSAPDGRSLLRGHFRSILGRPDAESYARDLATAVRELASGSLSPDVVREAVRGALNGWRGDEVGEKGTLEQRVVRTRETLWLMRRFRVTNLAWLYRWRIAAAVRRYQEQEKAASAQQAAQLAKLTGGGAGDDR
ncbi:Glycosyltransferase sugar-binding region containing DXD motif-containing protein [Amycolatopsis saalfeldensis]|uniref:Glycosyltransferase sugar-binding region containing DXD motif-containing protein n=1 Tax=Amycolatopsis saalfeldensis TaxID=394193 RepID=A0A1H8YNS2_9PSEU|nr:Glycosyltransferase sugar-binding region containing DXD motif-containing protein [Amycolatopsis saalfeldensis]